VVPRGRDFKLEGRLATDLGESSRTLAVPRPDEHHSAVPMDVDCPQADHLAKVVEMLDDPRDIVVDGMSVAHFARTPRFMGSLLARRRRGPLTAGAGALWVRPRR
jgi:hypothetical protein